MSGGVIGAVAQLFGLAQGATGGTVLEILAMLENAGMGAQVRSWLGPGENHPVTAAQLGAAFSPEQLNDWAMQAGTTPDAVLLALSAQLPDAVSRYGDSASAAPE